MPIRSDRLDAVISLSKRRGFVYPSSEIYGGLRAAWDYGPLGVELKNNIKRQWWRAMVTERDDVVGIDSSVILAREVWEASGHVNNFTDPRNFNGLLSTHLGATEDGSGLAYLRPETAQGIFINYKNVLQTSRK